MTDCGFGQKVSDDLEHDKLPIGIRDLGRLIHVCLGGKIPFWSSLIICYDENNMIPGFLEVPKAKMGIVFDLRITFHLFTKLSF